MTSSSFSIQHQPQRSFYVAFGHDEEVSGNGGAGEMAKILQQTLEDHEEELSFILDEGVSSRRTKVSPLKFHYF